MDFKLTESKWQKYWATYADVTAAKDDSVKPKKYVLVEFPYPSGSGLHVGHAFSFTGGDVYARFMRMKGYNVMFPMGWDAFGLPTENYAIKMKRKPAEVTKENTDAFRTQMKNLAFSFDWDREVNTTDPKYYKWTQWIFIKLFEKGLAHKEEMPINWCPSCKIGLANEEVIDGKCERCHTEVSRRNISQWVVKITDYADRLIDGLKDTAFIDKVKQAQINWIGKSEGARIRFVIAKPKAEAISNGIATSSGVHRSPRDDVNYLEVFTTRPDTIYGATFMVVAPEHKIVEKLKSEEINEYVKMTQKKSEMERTELSKEKTGVFSGLYAINPVTNKEIPIWISDFVLASYGTGAIMSVPAIDDRDREFAIKYNLPIVEVPKDELDKPTIGEKTSSYHLRDWIFSRQHYWGEPIPMIDCPKCGWVTEKEENLPIVLPEVEAYEPTDDGLSPLSRIPEFVNCICPKCGGKAKRETDTMPNWAGSDWYFLRYCDPHNNNKLADFDILKKWLPVDLYIGGDEHNTLHLLYSRFIHQFLFDLGVVPTPEPYYKRLSHGVILGPDNNRMSKSKGNVIVPEVVADKYGVDVIRMYLMFMGPFDGTMAWNENTLMGVKRFLDRFNNYAFKQIILNGASSEEVKMIINRLAYDVAGELSNLKFNTTVAKLMEALNNLEKYDIGKEELMSLFKVLAPLAPYTAEECWSKLNEDSVHSQLWPEVDPKYLVDKEIIIVLSINGKRRGEMVVDVGATKDEIIARAKEQLGVKNEKKMVYVEGKLVNYVI